MCLIEYYEFIYVDMIKSALKCNQKLSRMQFNFHPKFMLCQRRETIALKRQCYLHVTDIFGVKLSRLIWGDNWHVYWQNVVTTESMMWRKNARYCFLNIALCFILHFIEKDICCR